MSTKSNTVAVAYVPVLHRGYQDFFAKAIESGATALYLVGDHILATHEELDYLNRKDRLRAVSIETMQRALSEILTIPVHILTRESVSEIQGTVVLPKEDVSALLVQEYFKVATVIEIPIFLRWHRDNSSEEKMVEAHRSLSVTDIDKELMGVAVAESEKSFDWWRQIGAVLVKGGEVIAVGHNTHMPDEQSPNVNGDPRAVYSRGVNIALSTALHAEESLIAEAARKGIALEGASLYVTEFPCPYCARLIAHAGIKKCFFSKGYAVLDGEMILKDAGVELIFVDMKKEQD